MREYRLVPCLIHRASLRGVLVRRFVWAENATVFPYICITRGHKGKGR